VELKEAVAAILRNLDGRWGVDAAWLFGSQVRTARADSDIDMAVLFRTRPDGQALLDARTELGDPVGRPVDIVDLDVASPIIAHQAIKTGRLVADHTPRRRIEFLTRLPDRYEDLTLVRRTIEETILKRIAHGRTRRRPRQDRGHRPLPLPHRRGPGRARRRAPAVGCRGHHRPLLEQHGVLEAALSGRLRKMVGFRNLAVHDYQTIDRTILESIVTTRLDDLRAFAAAVAQRFGVR
jgi:predicted nucleotidyltransferase